MGAFHFFVSYSIGFKEMAATQFLGVNIVIASDRHTFVQIAIFFGPHETTGDVHCFWKNRKKYDGFSYKAQFIKSSVAGTERIPTVS